MNQISENVKNTCPLVHHITNYVTVNDCANLVLAGGGAPLMADDLTEVEDIVSISQALYINIGTLNKRTVESMILAGKKANELSIPIILDPVGMGASKLRNETVHTLIKSLKISLIKGNMSEIKGLYSNEVNTGGVDVKDQDLVTTENLDQACDFVKKVARQLDTVIAVTGPIDIISDGKKTALIRNGHPIMSRVTGTGCMTGSLISTYIAANPDQIFMASLTAVSIMGLAGQEAYQKKEKNKAGISSYKSYLIDSIDLMTPQALKEGSRFEII